jgi:hypothetical protein
MNVLESEEDGLADAVAHQEAAAGARRGAGPATVAPVALVAGRWP